MNGMTALERLEHMGFRKVGSWTHDGVAFRCALTHEADSGNILYAFVSNGSLLYIGKTVQPLKRRMYGYQNPASTQSTNIKANNLIKEILATSAAVDVYALPGNGLLYYGGFHVNLAAGLEDNLIKTLCPPWNKAGA